MSDDYQSLGLGNVHEMCACYQQALLVKITHALQHCAGGFQEGPNRSVSSPSDQTCYSATYTAHPNAEE